MICQKFVHLCINKSNFTYLKLWITVARQLQMGKIKFYNLAFWGLIWPKWNNEINEIVTLRLVKYSFFQQLINAHKHDKKMIAQNNSHELTRPSLSTSRWFIMGLVTTWAY